MQTDTVPLLHGEDMSSVVAHSDGIWLIAVHNDVQCGEPCQIVADTLQAAHTKVGDLVNFATSVSHRCSSTQAQRTHAAPARRS